MDNPSRAIQDLARRLLTDEAASNSGCRWHTNVGMRVIQKLQISVTRFAGADGFVSLLRRALVLAHADVPSLKTVEIPPHGSPEGIEVPRWM